MNWYLIFYQSYSCEVSIAKSIRYEVTNAASQEFFVADGGVVTLSYQYRGNNTVDSFSWVTFSPVTKIADFGLASNAVPPYSVTGSLAEGRTNLMITSVNTSLSGKVYQCSVILLLSNTVRSGPAKLSLKGELLRISLFGSLYLIAKIFRCYLQICHLARS